MNRQSTMPTVPIERYDALFTEYDRIRSELSTFQEVKKVLMNEIRVGARRCHAPTLYPFPRAPREG